jgi:hypothetical protein
MAELNDPATGGGAAAGGFCRCAIDNENVERGQSPQRLGPRSPLPTPVRCEGSGLNVASGRRHWRESDSVTTDKAG